MLARAANAAARRWPRRALAARPAAALGAILLLLAWPAVALLRRDYHVLGTDKVGQDVLYQALKSIRTSLVIGTLTTLVLLPLGIALGIMAGYFRGWVDDVIQYLYTTLNSDSRRAADRRVGADDAGAASTAIPSWFQTAAQRADLRLLSLCVILGLTSWTGLARLLRGETLKLSRARVHPGGARLRRVATRASSRATSCPT